MPASPRRENSKQNVTAQQKKRPEAAFQIA
jgi:hypothetical protein